MAEETTQVTQEKTASAGERSEQRSSERPVQRGGERREQRPRQGGGRFVRRRKFCKFCADKNMTIDHKNPDLLRQLVTDRYKILPSRVTGTCAKHQRALTTAVKRARVLALLPFTPLHHD
ncbi:MAG: 30S ribosomal protein S18 [Mariprofundaceae bacterium]